MEGGWVWIECSQNTKNHTFFTPSLFKFFIHLCSLSMCFFAAPRIINPSQKLPLGCRCGCFFIPRGGNNAFEGWMDTIKPCG